jgi:hypothetical protein
MMSIAAGKGDRTLLAFASEDRLRRILERMLDEKEFLSDYGIRSCVVILRCLFTTSLMTFSTSDYLGIIKITLGRWK